MPAGVYLRSEKHLAKVRETLSPYWKSGKESLQWKGDRVGYHGVHFWIKSKYGKADHCENEDCPGTSKIYDWANISGQNKRDRKDFKMLCRSCHIKFDKKRSRGETAYNSKLNNLIVKRIRYLSSVGVYQREIAKIFGVCQKTVATVIHGITWKHVK